MCLCVSGKIVTISILTYFLLFIFVLYCIHLLSVSWILSFGRVPLTTLYTSAAPSIDRPAVLPKYLLT